MTILKTIIVTLVITVCANLVYAQHSNHNHHESEDLGLQKNHSPLSLHQIDTELTSHRKESLKLSSFTGETVIVVMFYGSCTNVCPILIKDAWRLYSGLTKSAKKNTSVLAVSFDPENDTPEVLHNYAEYEQLNLPDWHFVTASESGIRLLATVLGVQYKKRASGMYDHSNALTIIDDEGNISKQLEGLNKPVDEMVTHIEHISHQ
jgi:protein SCO1/2